MPVFLFCGGRDFFGDCDGCPGEGVGDVGQAREVERVDGVGGFVVVGVAKVSGVGEHDCGEAFHDEGAVIGAHDVGDGDGEEVGEKGDALWFGAGHFAGEAAGKRLVRGNGADREKVAHGGRLEDIFDGGDGAFLGVRGVGEVADGLK